MDLDLLNFFSINCLPADFCHLLIIFANSLDPDHSARPDLNPSCLIL